ncbi:unnamed protein product, partial [Prorocentrum cordatum]
DLLPVVSCLLLDPEVRQGAAEALATLASHLRPGERGDRVLMTVIRLSQSSEDEDARCTAVGLFDSLAEALGRDLCRQFVVVELQALCEDPSARVRQAAGASFAEVSRVVGDDVVLSRLLPAFRGLVQDAADAESIRLKGIARALQVENRGAALTQLMEALLGDVSGPVQATALQELGYLIAELGAHGRVEQSLIVEYVTAVTVASKRKDAAVDMSYHYAFTFAAVARTMGREFWPKLRGSFEALCEDPQPKTRRAMAASLHVVAQTLGAELTREDVLPRLEAALADPDPEHRAAVALQAALGRTPGLSWRLRHTAASHLGAICEALAAAPKPPAGAQPGAAAGGAGEDIMWSVVVPLFFQLCCDPVAGVRDEAARSTARVLRAAAPELGSDAASSQEGSSGTSGGAQLNLRSGAQGFIGRLVADFAEGGSFRSRMCYIRMCDAVIREMPLHVFTALLLQPLVRLAVDRVKNVRLCFATTMLPHLRRVGGRLGRCRALVLAARRVCSDGSDREAKRVLAPCAEARHGEEDDLEGPEPDWHDRAAAGPLAAEGGTGGPRHAVEQAARQTPLWAGLEVLDDAGGLGGAGGPAAAAAAAAAGAAGAPEERGPAAPVRAAPRPAAAQASFGADPVEEGLVAQAEAAGFSGAALGCALLLGVLGGWALAGWASRRAAPSARGKPFALEADARTYNVGGPAIYHERLTLLPGYVLTPDGDDYAEVWAALHRATAQGFGATPASPFCIDLSATNVLGLAAGALALPDPAAVAPGAGARALAPAGDPGLPGGAAPAAGAPPAAGAAAALPAHGGPAAAGPPAGAGGVGALVAALGGVGAGAPAAAAPVPGAAPAAAAPPLGTDPRAMALVLDGRGFRDITFSDAAKLQTETVRADWPVKGPRTLLWALGFMLRMAGGAMAWHNRWIAMTQLGESDEYAKLHETLRRVIETALCHDQLVICELASYEHLARQLQLIEERAFEERARRSQPAPKAKAQVKELAAADYGSEVGHFLGTGETKGNLCICPALMDWIADQMKMGLTSLLPSLVSLARIAQRPSSLRLVWTRPHAVPIASAMFARYLIFLWMGAAIFRRVALLVCALPRVGGDPPAVQAASVDYLSSLHREFELPAAYSERSSACEASLVEMLAQAPGYAGDSGRVRPYSQPLVAWPKSTKAVSTSDVVSDADSIVLQGWRQTMLNPESVVAELRDELGIQRPYVDPELRYQPKSYAQFLKQLEAHDMISWRAASDQSSHTIGLFFVEKSNHMLRLAFDTRLANCSFVTPPPTKLPTPSAWASVDCDDSFVFAQGDIHCAFYHLRLPPGMESLFSLPAISNRHIGLTSIQGRPVGIHDFVQPLVTVVPMGWSWALHCCQSALVRALTDAGFDSGDMIVDGGLPVLEFSEAVSKGVFTGLQWSSRVYASDASTHGKGARVKVIPPDLVSEVGRVAEKWRCHQGPSVLARVPEAVFGFDGWKTIHSSRHTRLGCDILQYEAEALGLSIHHASRTLGAHHHRMLCLVDNLALALAVGKGRSGSPHLVRALRRLSGVTLARGLRLLVRWVPSERNVADKPSREGFFVGPSFEDFLEKQEVIKTARARKTHPGPSSLSRGSLSVLEASAVSASTGRNYHDCAQKFLSWSLWTARDFSCCADLDTALAVYFAHLFLDGYDSATGRTTLAALRHHLPSMLEVKDRGRWRTDQSLNRHAKRARMQQRLGQLAPALVDFGDEVEARLLQLMEVTARTGIFPLRLPPLMPASAPKQADIERELDAAYADRRLLVEAKRDGEAGEGQRERGGR